jgi:hypothetical protein
MFRKPKSKNVNQRRTVVDEAAGAETLKEPQETPIQAPVQTQQVKTSILTFEDEEDSEEIFG